MVASALRADFDEGMVSATASTLQGLGEQTTKEFTKGKFEYVSVSGTYGYAYVSSLGDSGVLIVITSKRSKIGIVLFAIKKARSKLGELL